MKRVLVACALGLCGFLFLNPGRALADAADGLATQYQDLQRVTSANSKQITSLQDSLDKMSGHVSHTSQDYQALQNKIIELKLKTNDLFEKKSDIATQLKKLGSNPDRPNSKQASAGKTPTRQAATAAAVSEDQPLQKEDGGEVASADVTKLPANLIPAKQEVALAKPVVLLKPQNAAGAPASDNTKSIASVVASQPDPIVEAAIDEKVKQQKPEVDGLIKLATGEPEPPPEAMAAAPIMPVESPEPQAVQTPGTNWTAIAIGTVLVGGAIAAGVAASSGGGSSGGHSSAIGSLGGHGSPIGGLGGRHYSPCH
jgi:hypothetical protein